MECSLNPATIFDPLDQLADEDYDGLALHLCIDYDMLEALPCDTTACFLAAIPARELLGYCERMDTFAFAARAAVDLRRAEALQPYFGWRPLQVIRKTLEQTTQLAASQATMAHQASCTEAVSFSQQASSP